MTDRRNTFMQFAPANLVQHKPLFSCFLPADIPSMNLMQNSSEVDVYQRNDFVPVML